MLLKTSLTVKCEDVQVGRRSDYPLRNHVNPGEQAPVIKGHLRLAWGSEPLRYLGWPSCQTEARAFPLSTPLRFAQLTPTITGRGLTSRTLFPLLVTVYLVSFFA